MRINLTLLFVTLSTILCYGQDFNPIQFDTVNRATATQELFLKNIIETDKDVFEIDNANYSALEVFKKYKQTRYAVQIDIKNSENTIIGQNYAIERYVEHDTTFSYENLKFNRFHIFSDTNNKTIGFKLYSGNQNSVELHKFIAKYTPQDKNSAANDEQNYYVFKLKDSTIILKITNDSTAEPAPMSMSDAEPVPVQDSNKPTLAFSPPIELTVIFTDLSSELEDYLKEY